MEGGTLLAIELHLVVSVLVSPTITAWSNIYCYKYEFRERTAATFQHDTQEKGH